MTLLVSILVVVAATALAAARLRARAQPLARRIDAVLPQTQCRQCGHDGCGPYAEAIAAGEAINRCPPGGTAVVRKLAAITGRPAVPLDVTRGAYKPRQLAFIDEARCIGCTLCIRACPVDAIVGSAKLMHTVIASDCTGCELCVPACPVDCIVLEPLRRRAADLVPGHARARAASARRRFEQRSARLDRERREHAERMAAKSSRTPEAARTAADEARKHRIVEAALQRARARLAALP